MTGITEDLAKLLGAVSQPGDFCTAGKTELLAPLLTVDGVGPLALPLLPVQAEQLVAVAEPAPYGRGEDTVFDPAVRRCWQIGPERVRIAGRHWAETLRTIVARAADGLGVSDPIRAEFYKLLVYDPGSFFVGHRDTEKLPGMFATLLVVLPSQFEGGALVVRHKDREVRLDMVADDPAEVAFAAFYADCVHEVLPVSRGYRITLVYNLVREGRGRLPQPPDHAAQRAGAADLLDAWRAEPPEEGGPDKLVYLLEHAYTPAELDFSALKGADAAIAGVLAAAASRAQCDLHLALLTIEESGSAEYSESHGSRHRHWQDDEGDFEAGDVEDRSVFLSDWRRPDGGACVLGKIPVEEQEFSPPNACDDLAPDEEEFHEATGNEGVSFDRTYRHAVLVLWPSGRMFAVMSQAGLPVTVPFLEDLGQRWADGGAGPEAPLWREAHDLAGQMLARWPEPSRYGRHDTTKPSDAARVLDVLSRIGDTETIERVLTTVIARGDYETGDNTAILRALDQLAPPRVAPLIERITSGTVASVYGAVADLLRRAAAQWPDRAAALAGAAVRLVEALPGDPAPDAMDWYRTGRSRVDRRFVADLLPGLAAIDATLARRAVAHLLAYPARYGMDEILVPALRDLAAAGPVESDAVELLRSACLAHVRARVAEDLAPPADWRRESALRCACARCTGLARFLADPAAKAWALKAAEADRRHVADTIRQANCDLDLTTEQRGRPYSLVCTKNQASYERRAKQRQQDLDDLARFGG
jgi:hypothetical protein